MTSVTNRNPPHATAVSGTRICLLVGAVLAVAAFTPGTTRLCYWNETDGSQLSIGVPFTLRNGDGRTVTDQYFRGKYMLAYFGYTFCPDVRPTTLSAVAQALDRLGPKAKQV